MTGPIALQGAPLPMDARSHADAAPADVRRAAEEFEAVFLSEMLSPMFEGLQTDGLGGGGVGEEIFRPMLVERYAEAVSRAGGVGIADSIVRELMRLQEASAPSTETPDGADR
ncbi:MAG: rod-binding protein [Hyphomonadaceae bacterium]